MPPTALQANRIAEASEGEYRAIHCFHKMQILIYLSRLLIAAALGIPAVYYFATKGDSKPGDISGQHHGANQEYKKSGEGNN